MEIDITGKESEWSLSLNITGTFLGFTQIECSVEKISQDTSEIHHSTPDHV